MRLYIKNKFFSLTGGSKVFDDEKKNHFIIKGKFFTITHKKKIYDTENNLLYTVRNKYWHVPFSFNRYGYIFNAEGERIATIKAHFGFHKNIIVQEYKDEISIDGDFWGWKFTISKNGVEIGSMRRELISLTDTFVIDVESEEDKSLLVALVICFDNICDNLSDEANNN